MHCITSSGAVGCGTALRAVVQLVDALHYKQWCSWLRHCATSSGAVCWGTALQAVVRLVEAMRYRQ